MTATAHAELVVRNAKVFTAAEHVPPTATGFAVADGVIIAVADHDAELESLIGPTTTVIDLQGAPVVPGLFDAHIHHIFGGKMLLRELHFPATLSLDQALDQIDAGARKLPEGAWLVGGSWGSTLLDEVSTVEARRRLDAASHGHPAMLSDDSHHNAWVNTAGLVAAGLPIDGGTDLLQGTVIDRNTGELTGVLLEHAVDPVRRVYAEAEQDSVEDLKGYALEAWKLLHSYGVTGIQDAAINEPGLQALIALDDEGKLNGWVSCCLTMAGGLVRPGPGFDPDTFDRYAREHHRDRVRTDFTKLFLDGVPPTRTAGMLEAYLPDEEHGHDHHGVVYMTVEELIATLRDYDGQGRSTKIHCAGDWSTKVAIDAFEALRREGSTRTYHIAHGQFVAPKDRQRMAELDIVAEISPFIWYPGVIPTAIAAVLPEHVASRMHPNRELLDLGVLVAGGSDWSVVPTPNLWEGICGLVTRADPLGQFPGTLWDEQAVPVEEALRIFTINAAKAAHLDDVVGSIEVGKAANFAVVDRDPLTVEPSEIAETKVLETFVAGQVVYRADDAGVTFGDRTH